MLIHQSMAERMARLQTLRTRNQEVTMIRKILCALGWHGAPIWLGIDYAEEAVKSQSYKLCSICKRPL